MMRKLATIISLLSLLGCTDRPESSSVDFPRGLPALQLLELELDTKDLETVLLELDSLASLSTSLGYPSPDSIALIRAEVALRQGRYDDVIMLAAGTESLTRDTTKELSGAFSLLAGRALTRLGEYSAAQIAIRKALSLRQSLYGTTDLRTAETFHYLGLAFHEQGSHAKALQQYAEALRIRRVLSPEGQATAATLNNIGNIYWRRGEYEQALELHQEALRIKTVSARIPTDLGITHANLANLFSEMGLSQRSDHHFETALLLYSSGHPNPLFVAKVHNDFGSHLWDTGRPQRARANWEDAILLYNEVLGPEHSSVGIVETNLANSLVMVGEFHRGYELFRIGIKKVQADSRPNTASVMAQFAEAVSQAGRQDLANRILREALEWETQRNARIGHTHLRLERDRARFLQRENRLRDARAVLERVIVANAGSLVDGGIRRLSRDVVSMEELLGAFTAWTDVILETLDRGQIQWAESEIILSTFESAISHFLSYRALPLVDGSTAPYRQEFHSVLDDAYRFAYGFDSHFHSLDSSQRLYRISEIRHATDLRETLAHDKAVEVANIPAALVTQEQRYRSELRSLQREAALSLDDETASSKAVRLERAALVFALEDSLARLVEMYKIGFPAYFRLRYSGTSVSMDQVQSSLEEKACLVVFHVVDDWVSALALRRDDFSAVNLGEYTELRSDVNSYLLSVQQDVGAVSRPQSSALYDRLVAPVSALSTCDKWIVVLDGALTNVPLESLVFSSGGPDTRAIRYLIEEKTISYANSATAFYEAHNDEKSRAEDGLFAAAPVFSGGVEVPSHLLGRPRGGPATVFGELRGSGREVVAISRLFDRIGQSSKSTILLSGRATERQIKTASLRDYRFVHLATHGIAVESHPTLSGLLLSPSDDEDGLLQVGEILSLRLAAEMVVLSACETGKSETSRGRDFAGLTGAFLYAGANTVVASLWNSDDAYTAATMAHFYNNILSGQSKSEALRQAKLTLMEDPEVAARPSLWAPFIMIGES